MDPTQIYEVLNEAYFSDHPHEQEVIRNLGRLVSEGEFAIDAGASLGQYTRALAQIVRKGEVHAIEADPIRAEELARNCDDWAKMHGGAIVAHHMALGATAAERVPYFVTNSDVSGGLSPHETGREVEWEEISVPGGTLDGLCVARLPDFVKIDVEGAELEVLDGAARILDAGNAVFLIELHDWNESEENSGKVLRLMRRHGYKPRVVFYGQSVFVKSLPLWIRLKALELLTRARLKLAALGRN
jgi:FkbM family methyltransferase